MLLTGFGQPSEPELITDRPDQTESSVVVPPGYVQIETGWSLSRDDEGGIRSETHQFPGTLFRIGAFNRMELPQPTTGVRFGQRFARRRDPKELEGSTRNW